MCHTGLAMDMSFPACRTVEAVYARPDTLLVFPSEVIAASWRRALARDGRRRAVRADRIISWDVFKELAVPIKRTRRPAGSLARRAFCASAIGENAGTPFLSVLVDPRFADGAGGSVGALTRMLPQLPVLLSHRDALRGGLVQDLTALMERYNAFLNRHGLFEPNWELTRVVDLRHVPWRPVVFWPALLEDYHEYDVLLGDRVETVPLPQVHPIHAVRRRSAQEEISATFDAVEAYLNAGGSAYRAAVTAADLEAIRPWLEAEAARRGIPLRFAVGGSVASQAGGRLFPRMQEVLDADFNVSAVAGLITDESIPWKGADFNRLLVRFGYTTHCYSASRWDVAFDTAQTVLDDAGGRHPDVPVTAAQLPILSQKLTRLRRDLLALRSARTVAALRRALRAFLDHHVEPPGHRQWADDREAVEPVYETALTELEAILRLEERGIDVPHPWSFFLDALEDRLYVARNLSGAVAVYPYRVAAGAAVEFHGVLGLSHAATRVRSVPALGVRRDELQRMGWESRDRSMAFLRAYGGLVDGAVLSFSDDGPGGAQVPAAELTIVDDASPGGYVVGDGDLPPRFAAQTNLWDQEERWWRDTTVAVPSALYAPQRRGLARALDTALHPAGSDFRVQVVDPATRAGLRVPAELSAGAVDTFLACPFAFLFKRVLRVRREDYGFRPDRAIILGRVLHAALERLLHVPHARRAASAEAILAEAFAAPEAALLLAPAGRTAHQRFAASALLALLQDPAFESERLGATEVALHGTMNGVVLRGYADRIAGVSVGPDGTPTAVDDGPVTILDYKMTLHGDHTRGGMFGPDGSDPRLCRTVQLPLYALLTEQATGRSVERLVYVGLRRAEVKRVVDPSASGPGSRHARQGAEDFERLRASLPEFLGEMRAAVDGGDFRCVEEPDCTRCGIRSVCRSCFVTRRYGDER